MASLRSPLALLVCVALACSARTDIDLPPDEELDEEEEDLPECTAELTPRVEDCMRVATDAVPIARLVGDGLYLAADHEFLYYLSEGRVFRLSMLGGEPEALTPIGSAGEHIQYTDGFVYWTNDDVLYRVPATGGDPEPLLELEHGSSWAIAGDAIVSAAPYGNPFEDPPTAVFRTSMTTGDTTEIVPAEDHVSNIGVSGGYILVERAQSLVGVPVEGGAPRVLSNLGSGALQPPIVHDGEVYFSGTFPVEDHFNQGLLRVDIEQPSTPEVLLPGSAAGFAVDGDALYAHIIPTPEIAGEKTRGHVVRMPLEGGDAVHIAYTSSYAQVGYAYQSNGFVVAGCNVYFIDRCTAGPEPGEHRLVTVSKVP